VVRRAFGLIVLGLVALLACAGVHAATATFDTALKADGTTFGQAKGSLEITPAAEGRLAWKLSGGQFTPATVPGSTVVWDEGNLAGSGSSDTADKLTLKEFEVTVRQSSGVDISYSFRLTATVEDGKPVTVALEQVP